MNIEQLRKTEYIIYETISGSRCYGTNTTESDLDIRGFYIFPNESYLSLSEPPAQISDNENDVTFYSLKRAFELFEKSSPNMIELLFVPKDCVLKSHPIAEKMIENRSMFISKKAYNSFSEYAYSQCKRSRGQNKWVNNPKPETPPDKMDFCWVIPVENFSSEVEKFIGQSFESKNQFPFRPIPLKESGMDLSFFHCAKFEHIENTYRIYWYGKDSKGIFRGPNQQLVVESIPFDDEVKRFSGMIVFNEDAYNSSYKDWKNYWEWKKCRNESRYRSQEAGEIDYDSKNISHCVRLLLSGKNILENGEPIVRFYGSDLQFLKDIRAGKFEYEEIMSFIEDEMKELENIKERSKIPESVNHKEIEKLYKELIFMKR